MQAAAGRTSQIRQRSRVTVSASASGSARGGIDWMRENERGRAAALARWPVPKWAAPAVGTGPQALRGRPTRVRGCMYSGSRVWSGAADHVQPAAVAPFPSSMNKSISSKDSCELAYCGARSDT